MLAYADPNFGEHFTAKVSHVRHLFDSHPVLAKKQHALNSLNGADIIALQQNIFLALDALSAEKDMWSHIALNKETLHANQPFDRQLDSHEVDIVKENAALVKQAFGNQFSHLEEYSLVSSVSSYDMLYADYQKFLLALEAVKQLQSIHELVNRQSFLLKRLDAKTRIDAGRIHPHIEELQHSLQDQQALVARLPTFSLKDGFL